MIEIAEKIIVNTKKCIGCGLCASIAPASFEIGPDGKSHVKNPPGDPEGEIQRAIDGCPVKAISWKK